MSSLKITKTSYLQYLACREEFWMQKHQPELMPPFSDDARHKVEQGNIIDKLAQQWFEEHYPFTDRDDERHEFAFQFEAVYDNFQVVADIVLFKGEKRCDLYEVKAATKEKPEHTDDIAFQKMVFEKAGYEVERTFLIHVDSDCVLQDALNLKALLKARDLTGKVNARMAETEQQAFAALEWLQLEKLPEQSIRAGCSKKTACPYIQHYHQPVPEYNIFHISRLHSNKLQALLDRGIFDICDVPADFELSPKQRLQVDVAQSGQPLIQTAEIREILNNLSFPLYFLDYESFSYVIPPRPGLSPYQHLVFQYSLHVLESADAEAQHYEYLLPAKDAPVTELLRHMQAHIAPEEGTVIVWNDRFEKGRNSDMAALFPEYKDFLSGLNDRVFDLMEIFSNGLCVHPEFLGSASIKRVLPALCPELNYGQLDIQSGTIAVIKWHHMTDGKMSSEEAEKTYRDLLQYCKLDTWAMVRIWEELRKAVG